MLSSEGYHEAWENHCEKIGLRDLRDADLPEPSDPDSLEHHLVRYRCLCTQMQNEMMRRLCEKHDEHGGARWTDETYDSLWHRTKKKFSKLSQLIYLPGGLRELCDVVADLGNLIALLADKADAWVLDEEEAEKMSTAARRHFYVREEADVRADAITERIILLEKRINALVDFEIVDRRRLSQHIIRALVHVVHDSLVEQESCRSVGHFPKKTSTGTDAITGVGFQPDIVQGDQP